MYNENWSPGSQVTSKSRGKIQKSSRSSREIPSNKELVTVGVNSGLSCCHQIKKGRVILGHVGPK